MSGKFRYTFQSMAWLLTGLLVLGLVTIAYTARIEHTTYTAYLSVDTLNDTTSGTGISAYQDTFKVARMVWPYFEVSGIDFWAILDSSVTTTHGLGLSDSCYIWIYKVRSVHGNEQFELVDSVVTNGSPCTLNVLLTASSAGTWREYWSLVYRIADTTSDTVMTPSYNLSVDYKLIGK